MIPTNNKMGPPPMPKPKAKELPLPPPPPGAPKPKPMSDGDGDEGENSDIDQMLDQLESTNPEAASALVAFVKAMLNGAGPAPDLGPGPEAGPEGGM